MYGNEIPVVPEATVTKARAFAAPKAPVHDQESNEFKEVHPDAAPKFVNTATKEAVTPKQHEAQSPPESARTSIAPKLSNAAIKLKLEDDLDDDMWDF